MTTTNPITGKQAVALPIRRAVATFVTRTGKPETLTLPIPTPTNDEINAVEQARNVIAETLLTDPDAVKVGDKDGETYPVVVAPATAASVFFTLE